MTRTTPKITHTCGKCGHLAPLVTVGQILEWVDTLQWDTPAYLIARQLTETLVVGLDRDGTVKGVKK